MRFRLIPLTLIACFSFMIFKGLEIWSGQKYLARGFLPPAYAQEAEPEETEAADKEEAKAEESKEEEKAEEQVPVGENKNVSLKPPEKTVDIEKRFNQVELDLLQSLSQRREEIDAFENELLIREKMLEATEMRINEKIQKMDRMQVDLKELLERNKKQEDTEMKSLVKIYESMKPKEAARIFNELNMTIMLEVIDRMSERKAAPILANMEPKRAQEVTVKLAEMRQIRRQATRDLTDAGLAVPPR
jgi:flagellar motility protein MotE (MotC chaperone)